MIIRQIYHRALLASDDDAWRLTIERAVRSFDERFGVPPTLLLTSAETLDRLLREQGVAMALRGIGVALQLTLPLEAFALAFDGALSPQRT